MDVLSRRISHIPIRFVMIFKTSEKIFIRKLDALVNNAAVQIAKPLMKPLWMSGTRSWRRICVRCFCS